MLDIAGKLFEQILSRKLETVISSEGHLLGGQFSFRKDRYTLDAINRVFKLATSIIGGGSNARRKRVVCFTTRMQARTEGGCGDGLGTSIVERLNATRKEEGGRGKNSSTNIS